MARVRQLCRLLQRPDDGHHFTRQSGSNPSSDHAGAAVNLFVEPRHLGAWHNDHGAPLAKAVIAIAWYCERSTVDRPRPIFHHGGSRLSDEESSMASNIDEQRQPEPTDRRRLIASVSSTAGHTPSSDNRGTCRASLSFWGCPFASAPCGLGSQSHLRSLRLCGFA